MQGPKSKILLYSVVVMECETFYVLKLRRVAEKSLPESSPRQNLGAFCLLEGISLDVVERVAVGEVGRYSRSRLNAHPA